MSGEGGPLDTPENHAAFNRREAALDAMTTEALARAKTRGPGASLLPPATRENALMAWDLTRFVLWKGGYKSIREAIRVASKALEYTGE